MHPAEAEAEFSKAAPLHTPQTEHPAYKLAFQDRAFQGGHLPARIRVMLDFLAKHGRVS